VDFPPELKNSIWHTTIPSRYRRIKDQGFILPDPDIPDSERWGTAMGLEYFPFVRSLGGVSLFDFRFFDPNQYSELYPFSMWGTFVPCKQNERASIWIELDAESLSPHFIDGAKLVDCWKKSGQFSRKLMPIIEAAHIGPLPIKHFLKVLHYERATNLFTTLTDLSLN
jgi:hypothetical protein